MKNLTPEQAVDLAARTLAAIDSAQARMTQTRQGFDTDRERVASDLAGFLRHEQDPDKGGDCTVCISSVWPCPDRVDRETALIRTAQLYGVS